MPYMREGGKEGGREGGRDVPLDQLVSVELGVKLADGAGHLVQVFRDEVFLQGVSDAGLREGGRKGRREGLGRNEQISTDIWTRKGATRRKLVLRSH